jgi:hypothetical protein
VSHEVINAALAERLKALNVPAAYENAQFSPTDGVLYLEEHYLPARTTPVGLAFTDSQDFTGIYQVNVCAPTDKLKLAGMQAAGAVAKHFARGTSISKDGLNVLCERADQAPALKSGNRWIIPVSVRFRCFAKP